MHVKNEILLVIDYALQRFDKTAWTDDIERITEKSRRSAARLVTNTMKDSAFCHVLRLSRVEKPPKSGTTPRIGLKVGINRHLL